MIGWWRCDIELTANIIHWQLQICYNLCAQKTIKRLLDNGFTRLGIFFKLRKMEAFMCPVSSSQTLNVCIRYVYIWWMETVFEIIRWKKANENDQWRLVQTTRSTNSPRLQLGLGRLVSVIIQIYFGRFVAINIRLFNLLVFFFFFHFILLSSDSFTRTPFD